MALGSNEIKLIISAVDKASKDLDKVNKSLGKIDDTADEAQKSVGKSGQSMGLNFKNLATTIGIVAGAAAAFGVAVKKAMDLGKEGAQIELTAGKFDRLSTSIGTTSSALMADLKVATRGTVSDLDLMTSATDFLALGLAKDHNEVVRLTRVAGALGMDMNQLVLTLTNMTTMRFDALGVSVDGFDDKVKKLEQSGLDAGTAFRQAFLEQAEAQIEKVGDVADTSAGKIMQFEAAAENLGSTIKTKLAPVVTNLYQGLFELIASTQEELVAMGMNEKQIRQNADSYAIYRASLDKVLEGTKYMIDEEGNLLEAHTYHGATTWVVVEANMALRDSTWEIAEADQALVDDINAAKSALEGQAGATKGVTLAQKELKEAMSDLKTAMAGAVGREIEAFNDKMEDLQGKANDLKTEIEDLESKEYLTDEQKSKLDELQTELGDTEQAIDDIKEAHNEQTKQILWNLLEQKIAQSNMTDEMKNFAQKGLMELAHEWGLVDDATYDAILTTNTIIDLMSAGFITTTDEAKKYYNQLLLIDGTYVETEVHTVYTESGLRPYAGGVDRGGTKNPTKKNPGGQHGGLFAGGPLMVGEAGPELLFLPPGYSSIMPNHKTQQVTNNWNMTINEAGRVVDPVRSFALMQALAGV